MTVKELKERLEGVPDDAKVYFRHFWGFGYKQVSVRDSLEMEGRDGRKNITLSNCILDENGKPKSTVNLGDVQ